MVLFNEIERLNRINYLIKHRATGTPDELASKLPISRRQLFNLLEFFNDIGAQVKYDRTRGTYYYYDGFDFEITVNVDGRRRFL